MNNLATNIEAVDAAAAPEARSRLPNLQDYLRVLLRHKWGVIGLAVIGAALGALKAYSDTPIYRATATLLIERQAARYVSIDAIYQSSPGFDFGEYYQTQYEILKSRPIAQRVVDKLGIAAFAPKGEQPRGFSLRRLVGGDAPSAPASPEAQYEGAVGMVQGGVQVLPIRNSQLVKIQFEGPDPELITKLANTVPQAYIEETLEGRLQMTESASAWLGERLTGLRQKLDESERALQEYRDRERLIDVQGVDSLASQELGLATERLAQARRERADKETLYRQVQEVRAQGGALESIPALAASPLVGELKTSMLAAERTLNEMTQRYGPKHPRRVEAQTAYEAAKSAFDRQLATVADGLSRDFDAARQRENLIAGELGSAKGQVRDVNRKQYELSRLEREVESNRALYEQFQTRSKETSAAGGVQNANARLIEAAQAPTSPVLPMKQRTMLIGLVLGLLLGVALAFLLDHLDNTLKGPEDVESRLNIGVLGQLPRLDTKGGADRAPLRHFAESPKSSFSEAVRTIRTSVLLSAIDQPHKRLLITSSVPGEGKTTLSVNLAHALGQMRKVLLIDADMRRPTVHRGLPDLDAARGLSHFVAGEANISDCLQRLGESNVYVMPAGPVPPNPQELLSSKRFEDALAKLSDAFDHVIIDCAPACAVSDALVLSRLVHAVVYVVRSDATPWQLADQGLKRLRRVGAPLIGAVVNQVVPTKGKYAGYGKYYYYGDGYHTDYGYDRPAK